MSTLFDLTGDRLMLLECLLAVEEAKGDPDEEGEALATLGALLEANAEAIADKVDDYCWVARKLAAEAEAAKAIAADFADKARRLANAERRVKDALLAGLQNADLKKVEGTDFTVRRQASPPSVSDIDLDRALAEGLAAEVVTIKPDSRAILAAYKANPESVAGLATVTQGEHIRIVV